MGFLFSLVWCVRAEWGRKLWNYINLEIAIRQRFNCIQKAPIHIQKWLALFIKDSAVCRLEDFLYGTILTNTLYNLRNMLGTGRCIMEFTCIKKIGSTGFPDGKELKHFVIFFQREHLWMLHKYGWNHIIITDLGRFCAILKNSFERLDTLLRNVWTSNNNNLFYFE